MLPREEWDFRGVAAEECDIASYWEYARELPRFSKDPKAWVHDKRRNRKTLIYIFSDGKHLTTPWMSLSPYERQAADAQFVKWLMEHQKEAGVFVAVSQLVDQLSDNPAAKMDAQEIADRVLKAEQTDAQGV